MGYVVLVMVGSTMTAGGSGSGMLVQIVGNLMPVVAGFVAARRASRWRVAYGIVGGAIGVVPMMLLTMLFIPGASPDGAFIIVLSYAMLAALGAILGKHIGQNVGP